MNTYNLDEIFLVMKENKHRFYVLLKCIFNNDKSAFKFRLKLLYRGIYSFTNEQIDELFTVFNNYVYQNTKVIPYRGY